MDGTPPRAFDEKTVDPKQPARTSEYVIEFENGVPVALNSKKMDGIEIVESLEKIAGDHGVGRIDHVEDRLIGIKSRETYECPAAITLITAHRSLEGLVLSKDVIEFKRIIEQKISQIIYDGLWFDSLRPALMAFVDETQKVVSGTVRVKLYKGNCTVVGRKSENSLYDMGLSTYSEGDTFDHTSAIGFIYCWGLPGRTAANIRRKESKK